MSREVAADAGFTAVEETKRVMKSALDAVVSRDWFGYSIWTAQFLHETFGYLLDTVRLVTADASALLTCRENVQVLRYSQMILMVIVLQKKFEIVEY